MPRFPGGNRGKVCSVPGTGMGKHAQRGTVPGPLGLVLPPGAGEHPGPPALHLQGEPGRPCWGLLHCPRPWAARGAGLAALHPHTQTEKETGHGPAPSSVWEALARRGSPSVVARETRGREPRSQHHQILQGEVTAVQAMSQVFQRLRAEASTPLVTLANLPSFRRGACRGPRLSGGAIEFELSDIILTSVFSGTHGKWLASTDEVV